jgi:uncharacterized SAM-binding protein YcdF (DUF218 family)
MHDSDPDLNHLARRQPLEVAPGTPVPQPRHNRKRWLFIRAFTVLLCSGLFAALAGLVGFAFAPSLLCVDSQLADYDALVILGGDQTARPARALELIDVKSPPLVLVTGDGDGDTIGRAMAAGGVPADRILRERQSRSTKENAEFSVPILRRHGVKKAVIVTSWFHSRRALACFKHYAPEIEFISKPTVLDRPSNSWPEKEQRLKVLFEYLKYGYYALWHWILPW